MSLVAAKKPKKNVYFWRSLRYLHPYRRIVTVSIVSAFFMAIIYTGGLGAMLPILQVLVNNETIAGWMDKHVVADRVGLTLIIPEKSAEVAASDDQPRVVISHVSENPKKLSHTMGLKTLEQITEVNSDTKADEIIALLADPNQSQITIVGSLSGPHVAQLPPVPFYFRIARWVAQALPRSPVKAIAAVFFIIMGMGMVGNVFRFMQEYLSDKAAISAVNDIRRHLYDHVLHMRLDFFGTSGTSDVTSRLVQDSQSLQDGFKIVLGQSIQEPFKAAFAFGLSMILSWKLTLFIVFFAPIMAVVIRKFGKKMRRASRAMLERSSHMLGQIESTLTGIRVVKTANAERFERRRYSRIMESLRQEMLKMARYEAYATPAMETITMLCAGAILMYASYLIFVHKPALEQTSFFLVMGCLVGIGESLRRLSKLNAVLARSNAAAARVFQILDIPEERRVRGQGSGLRSQGEPSGEPASAGGASTSEAPTKSRIVLPPIQREIRFENITFAYANTSTPAVDEVNLTIPKGKSIAVVGRNGSGKTTLLALLPRFFDPQAGRILIDGIDIQHATLKSLRRQIGIVTQEAVIFPGTIADNIAYGQPNASRDQIIAAARRAFAHDFILEKPDGYDTVMGEMGGQLSGGQRQRINIARAILRQTPILILDEATSQVDAESEHLIQQAIESIMHERTTFVIAHRFSTILSADTIVVMDRGRIIGQGSHDDLLRTCATYKQLYERQLFAA